MFLRQTSGCHLRKGFRLLRRVLTRSTKRRRRCCHHSADGAIDHGRGGDRRAGSTEAPASHPNPPRESWTWTNCHPAPRPMLSASCVGYLQQFVSVRSGESEKCKTFSMRGRKCFIFRHYKLNKIMGNFLNEIMEQKKNSGWVGINLCVCASCSNQVLSVSVSWFSVYISTQLVILKNRCKCTKFECCRCIE